MVNQALVVEGAGGVFAGDLGVVVVAFQGDLEFVADDSDLGDVTAGGVGAGDNIRKRDFLGGGGRGEERGGRGGEEQHEKDEANPTDGVTGAGFGFLLRGGFGHGTSLG